MAISQMWAVNGDNSGEKPEGVSAVYIANGDTSVSKPTGVSEVYAVNGNTSIPKPAGVSEIFLDGVDGTAPSGVSSVKVVNYSGNVLKDNTILFKFTTGTYDPSLLTTLTGATWTQISEDPNLWLWDASQVTDTDWSGAFRNKFTFPTEIMAAGKLTKPTVVGMSVTPYDGMFRSNNSLMRVNCVLDFPNAVNCSSLFQSNQNMTYVEGVKIPKAFTTQSMFRDCYSLEEVKSIETSNALTNVQQMFNSAGLKKQPPIFNTSKVSNFTSMFRGTSDSKNNFIEIPEYEYSSAETVDYMFEECRKIESGIVSCYNKLSALPAVTADKYSYSRCFRNCGKDTTSGAAELAQIPNSWK